MKGLFKKLAAVGISAVMLSLCAVPACAEEVPEPDENGVYGQAGIAWMIMDWWDYRRATSEDAMDETGANLVDSTYHDVNITGNGSYTVDMSGYNCLEWSGQQYNCGYLGLYVELPLVSKEDEENPTMVVTLDDVTIDGVTYTFLEQPQPEDSENTGKILKIKNGYGDNALTEPEMTAEAWKTSDPITINFTVSGLPTDKIEDYPEETVEKVCGYGNIYDNPLMNAGTEEEESSEEAEETAEEGEAAAADTEDAATAEETEDAATAEETEDAATTGETSTAAADSSEDEDSGLSTGAIVGICAACAAVIAAIIALVVKKKD